MSEQAWAAGFFDGEGCSHFNMKKYILVQVVQTELAPLERFKNAVGGIGNITGPYARPGRKSIYNWNCSGEKAKQAMRSLWPWLGDTKKKQFMTIVITSELRRKNPK